MTTFNMRLDIRKAATNIPQIRVGQGDNQTVLSVEVLENGKPYVFAEGEYLEFACIRPDGKWIHLRDSVVRSGSKWICTLDEHVTDASGVASVCYFDIRDAQGFARESTDRFELVVLKSATARANLAAYSDQVDRLLRECNSFYDAWNLILQSWAEDEEERKHNEEIRLDQENDRQSYESERKAAEAIRGANESERVAAELVRIENENFRIAKFEEFDARAKGWARYVCADGEFDPISRVPTLENPNPGTLYYVPIAESEQEEGNRYEEWTYTEISWEKLGKADMFYSSIGAEEIDRVVNDEQIEGQAALTTTGLVYYWACAKNTYDRRYASLDHTHDLSLLDGTLPLSKIDVSSNPGALALACMPVGYVYTSFDPTSPAELFGGTWEQLLDVFLRAGNDTLTGGSDFMTLEVANMPRHTHTFAGTAASHTHTFTGTAANHNHTFSGTAASHTHTFTGTAANHNHTFTGTAASHRHAPNGGDSSNTPAVKFVVLQNLKVVPEIKESLAWSGASSVSSGSYAPYTSVNYDWGTAQYTANTSITPAGTIANKSVTPAGTNSSTSITPAGSIGNTSITPKGTNSSTSITPAGTNSYVGNNTPFDNRPAYQNVYQWKRVA